MAISPTKLSKQIFAYTFLGTYVLMMIAFVGMCMRLQNVDVSYASPAFSLGYGVFFFLVCLQKHADHEEVILPTRLDVLLWEDV